MINTDGKQTIANAPRRTRTAGSRMIGPGTGPFVPMSELRRRPTASERIRQARELREAALDRGVLDIERERQARLQDKVEAEEFQAGIDSEPNRGPQANGQQWNDGYCVCGQAICDSPAGDKCWDCFNHDPSE